MYSIIPSKKVCCFPNNKACINKDIKLLLNKKKRAFVARDLKELKAVQKDLKKKLREGKNNYREKMEAKMKQYKTRCGMG